MTLKVVCTDYRGSEIPAAIAARMGAGKHSTYDVTVGAGYTAYAMALWASSPRPETPSGLHLLIVDDTGRPNWRPVELFDFSDRRIPDDWQFRMVDGSGNVTALWGYASLIEDPHHHDDLIERRNSALAAFLRDCGLESLAEA